MATGDGADRVQCRTRLRALIDVLPGDQPPVSEATYSDGHGEGCIEVPVDDHLAAGHGAAPSYRLGLQGQIVENGGVVPVDGALEALREDQVQVSVRARQECSAMLRGRILNLRLNSAKRSGVRTPHL